MEYYRAKEQAKDSTFEAVPYTNALHPDVIRTYKTATTSFRANPRRDVAHSVGPTLLRCGSKLIGWICLPAGAVPSQAEIATCEWASGLSSKLRAPKLSSESRKERLVRKVHGVSATILRKSASKSSNTAQIATHCKCVQKGRVSDECVQTSHPDCASVSRNILLRLRRFQRRRHAHSFGNQPLYCRCGFCCVHVDSDRDEFPKDRKRIADLVGWGSANHDGRLEYSIDSVNIRRLD